MRGREVPVEEAVAAAGEGLLRVIRSAGAGAVACLGSYRSSLETQASLRRFCLINGLPQPWYFLDPFQQRKVKRAVWNLDDRLAVSMGDIEKSDFVLVVGADPVNEAPMLALAIRQASREVLSNVQVIQPFRQGKGAAVAVIDPRPVTLPFKFDHLPVPPREIDSLLEALVARAIDRAPSPASGDPRWKRVEALAERLSRSRRPIIVCGTAMVGENTIDLAHHCAERLGTDGRDAGLFYILPGPNAFGAALLSPDSLQPPLPEQMEKGAIRGLLLVEADPFWLFPDHQRLSRAMERLDFLGVLDYLPSPSVERAQVVVPTETLFEQNPSTFVNQEGRLQTASPIHRGGTPIEQISGGNHPPRIHQGYVPGGYPRPAHEILNALSAEVGGRGEAEAQEEILVWLSGFNPVFRKALSPEARTGGVRLVPERRFRETFPSGPEREEEVDERLELLMVDQTFGTEELSSYSKHIRAVEPEVELVLRTEEGERLGLHSGDTVRITPDGAVIEVKVRLVENMAPGILLLPANRGPAKGKIRSLSVFLSGNQIRKVQV